MLRLDGKKLRTTGTYSPACRIVAVTSLTSVLFYLFRKGGDAATRREEVVDHRRMFPRLSNRHLHGQDGCVSSHPPPAVHGAGAHGHQR